ncbi:MAG: hypothetical protein ACTTIR_01105 [Eggerthia catenaformis]|uniref:hypothetical protein n=1 Tax=Eggerthia catenaformis TaxID=31973 RepID=UPI003C704344
MKKRILIEGNEFVLDKNGDYIGELIVWRRKTKVFLDLDENTDDVMDKASEKIKWLNNNRKSIINAFVEENDHLVDIVNNMIKNGGFKADKQISMDDFKSSLFVNNVCIYIRGRNSEFTLDLDAHPDYLFGHLACMEINSQYEVEFGGLNG